MKKIGEYIVYKKVVYKILEIKKKYFNNLDYYILIPVNDNSLIVKLPVENKEIRNAISKDEVENIINKMPNIDIIDSDERLIENEYKKLMMNGSYEDLIKIIKTTYLRNKKRFNNNKKIGDKDAHYFKRAEEYLYTEFGIALNMTNNEVRDYILDKINNIEG